MLEVSISETPLENGNHLLGLFKSNLDPKFEVAICKTRKMETSSLFLYGYQCTIVYQ
jgi:hypothetical protein